MPARQTHRSPRASDWQPVAVGLPMRQTFRWGRDAPREPPARPLRPFGVEARRVSQETRHRGIRRPRGDGCRKARPSLLRVSTCRITPGRLAVRRVDSGWLQTGNGEQPKPRQRVRKDAQLHGSALAAAAERRGPQRRPQGCLKPGHRDTILRWRAVGLVSTVAKRNARVPRAREPPRSMRWCQRRCDRGVWARDPDVC